MLSHFPVFLELRLKRINNASINELLIVVLFRRLINEINKEDYEIVEYLILLFSQNLCNEIGNFLKI